ncbi:DUF4124 domain-containing protein [Pelomonas sp. KK5]|uniref:DUF4124 domain-containing protein n=1 Tax=Pelomonas sp. KK5 TaxID=1855730 RepID=UPI00117FC26A|nr:DUF4124 domain-containing protein [Pelomonas sp. KK5]
MTRMLQTVTASVLALVACGAAQAQYRCGRPDGSVSFQQTPCAQADKSQKLDIKPASGYAAPEDEAGTTRPRPTVEQRMLSGLEAERRVRELEQQVADTENRIAQHNDAMEREIAALRARKTNAKNNLAGATWEQSLSTEMQAVTQKYQALNNVEVQRLRRQHRELDAARAALPLRTP